MKIKYYIVALLLIIKSSISFCHPPNKQIVLEEITVLQIQQALETGKFTSKELVEAYLIRIKEIDAQLNSIIEINPDAIKIAEQMDSERAHGKVRSKMHGIPFVIKDNIDTADNMHTTAGSWALFESPTPRVDAFVVKKLRQDGAILLAKTNLSEWANFRSEHASSGWSGRGGQTHNPYILDRSPCGSSSGSAVSVSANLAPVAIGTETDGSIVCPASINGIVGIKPSLGLVSRSGIIPIAHSQDTAGPMARTVTDAVIFLNSMVGKDKNDTISTQIKDHDVNYYYDYTKHLLAGRLNGARIGVARDYFGSSKKHDALMGKNLEIMKQNGAILIDVEFPDLQKIGEPEFEVLLYEFKNDLNNYLRNRGGKNNSLLKLIQYNKQNADKEMPYFLQELFEKAQLKKDLSDKVYLKALSSSKKYAQEKGIDAIIKKHKLDAIIMPSNSQSWLIDLMLGDSPSQYIGSSTLAAVSGYPSITVPSGFIDEMPIGISFVGQNFSEKRLIELAYSWEQLTKARKKPRLIRHYE